MVKVDIGGAEGELLLENTEMGAVDIFDHDRIAHDWLLLKKGTALSVLRAIAGLDRDFIQVGESIASIANGI